MIDRVEERYLFEGVLIKKINKARCNQVQSIQRKNIEDLCYSLSSLGSEINYNPCPSIKEQPEKRLERFFTKNSLGGSTSTNSRM